MTLFDFNRFSEIKDQGWSLNTLKPPLKLKDILLDFKIQWKSYTLSKISLFKRVKFLILRIFQRISYNLGWIKSTKVCLKMSIEGDKQIK